MRTPGDPWLAEVVGFIVVVVLLAERYALPFLDRFQRRYQRRHHARRVISPIRRPAGRRTHGPGSVSEPVSDAQPAAPFDLSAEPGSTFRA